MRTVKRNEILINIGHMPLELIVMLEGEIQMLSQLKEPEKKPGAISAATSPGSKPVK